MSEEEFEFTGGTGGAAAAEAAAAPAVMSDPHPWTWQEGDCTVIRGCARTPPGCHNNCGILMYVKDGKLVKVEGDPEHPYNQGRLCSRCLSLVDYVYHPDRILHPMRRARKDRGKDAWEECTWDEAYDLIEEEMGKIAKNYGPESVLFCQGTGRDIHQLFRLAYSYGSPNEGTPFFSGQSCYLPRIASMAVMIGGPAFSDASQFLPLRYDDPEYKVPELMVLWGNNPLWANPDAYFGHWVTDLMKRGMQIAVIDPQLSWLAARAGTFWLRIRPGSDGALAIGMLKVILEEKLYDAEWCDLWAYGLDELIERVAQYDLDEMARLTWIPKGKIVALARAYAGAKPATIQWGVAIDHSTGGQQAAHAITCLQIICGNLDMPGGNAIGQPCWGIEESNWTGGWGYDDVLPDNKKDKRIGVDKYQMFKVGFLNNSPDATMEAIETGTPYEIHGAWFETSNFLASMSARPDKWVGHVAEFDFNVMVDLFMTPTAMACCDVFLPASTFVERIGFGGLDPYFIGGIVKAIDPVGDTKPDNQIMLEMGKRWNPEAWPWGNLEEMNDDLLAQGGFTYKDLVESTWKYPKFEYRKYEKGLLRADGQMGFNTPTGRAELYSLAFQQFGLDPLPSYVEAYQSPYANPELTDEYPLVLTTGARQPVFFHSEHRQIKKLRRLHPDPLVYIHPETAARADIEEGDWVYVENNLARCKYKAAFNDTYDPRVIQAEHGWWFPERNPEDSGNGCFDVFESNVNDLIPVKCGVSGFGACFKTMICKIYRADDAQAKTSSEEGEIPCRIMES